MMRLATLALCLLAPFAAPATANSSTNATGCAAHGSDQIRCAQRARIHGQFSASATLSFSGDGSISGDVQMWTSNCGFPGQPQAVQRVTNANGQIGFSSSGTGGMLTGGCVEVFIFNCRNQAQQPVSCQRGFGNTRLIATISQSGPAPTW